MRSRRLPILVVLALASVPVLAQNVSGQAYEDRDGDGVRDPGEPGLAGVQIELYGTRDVGGALDQTLSTAADGSYGFSPGNGCYLLGPVDPSGWRLSQTREDGFPKTTSGYTAPVGQPRFAKLDHGIVNLKTGSLRFAAMGDSIARNFNICSSAGAFWYSTQVQSRLACTAPSATITLDQAAVLGEDTDDLLVDDHNDLNNVFRAIEDQPKLVTLSMIGNDLKDVDPPASPTQQQINKAVAEIIDSRQNLQEALSALTSEIPAADLAINSLYDNLAYNCYAGDSSLFHRQWLPIVNRILRDLAWGQTRRASINEAAAEFAHEDQVNACFGFDQQICQNILDKIHPTNTGYTIMREKVWEAVGGVNLGTKDALGRTSVGSVDLGYLRRVRRLLPTAWESRNGATATDPMAAMNDQDGGAAAQIQLGIGTEEFRLSGFPDYYDEVQIVRAIAGVRYRTTGTVNDDFYRLEASINDTFRPPPGHAYTTTNWNFYTPLVGGGGPNQPPENPDFPTEKLLAKPNVAVYREVSATLSKNPTLSGGAADYTWPPVSADDLTTATIRVAAAPVAATAGNDAYHVELDAAWLDLYGWEKPRPPEAQNLQELRLADGTLEVSFAPVAGAQRYNLYIGRLATARAGSYDHGVSAPVSPTCAATTVAAGGGRLKIVVPTAQQPGMDSYILVTAHVDDIESPSGARTGGQEIDRAQSVCR